jgi:2-polyprenyl-3-methyl-5-hydroxy-6-metoxy-1,4-benzoquinol methylase
MQNTIEERKVLEAEFHDRLRDPALRNDPQLYSRLTSNKKWYTVARQSKQFTESYLRSHSPGARALDFACGDGQYSLLMAEAGADVTGIDISETSVENSISEARNRRLIANFQVMDCEHMTFAGDTFDLINVNGVLHHMDLTRAYPELARVLKPTGSIMCMEAIAHNPVFHAYRKLTPHLRTEFETQHILRRKDVLGAKRYFNRVECKFFHLAGLAAVPLRKSSIFGPTLSILEKADSFLLSVSPLRWWAWQVAFILSDPKRNA